MRSHMNRLTSRLDDGTAYVRSETGNEGVGYFTTQRRLPELILKLAAYEDAEEQGRLVMLPCRCGECLHRHESEFCECRPADGYCFEAEAALNEKEERDDADKKLHDQS